MAYIGLQPQQQTVATSTEQLVGNGVDVEFQLSRAVSKAADLTVFVEGNIQVPETGYTAYDTTLLFAFDNVPPDGSDISVSYISGALSTVYIESNAFPVGSTTTPSIRSVDADSTGIYWPSTTSVGVTVSGNTRITVTDSPVATSANTGSFRVQGGAGVSGKLYVGEEVYILGTTQAENINSGALQVDGGVGIAKNTYVGGDLQVAGDFTVAGQFTTTAADSLVLNDPFVFLANANPGDNLDTGLVSSYNDGLDQRYTGIFRDITDGKYKLFDNLLVAPTTVVDTANVSYRLADLELGNVTATNIYGNIAGSTNITQVGNLTTLNVAGTSSLYDITYVYTTQESTDATTGALQVKGGVGVAGNINAGGIVNKLTGTTAATNTTSGVLQVSGGVGVAGNVYAGNVSSTYLTGTLTTAAQTSITSVGTLSSLTTSGAITSGGKVIPSANVTLDIGSTVTYWNNLYAATHYGTAGYFTGSVTVSGGIYGTVSTASQTSITSVGTLTSLAVSGAITVNSGNNVTAIVNSGTAGAGNIGSSGQGFNTAFVKATSAQYADVAERYLADTDYEPGTVLHFGGEYEVSQCNIDACTRIAGVVSTNPAYIMNDALAGKHVVDVALLGRVPCKVEGTVQRGDMMVSAGNGRARAEANPKLGSVIGKALENFDGAVGVIEVVVGRN